MNKTFFRKIKTIWKSLYNKTAPGICLVFLLVSSYLLGGIVKWYFPPALYVGCLAAGFLIVVILMYLLNGLAHLIFRVHSKIRALFVLNFLLLLTTVLIANQGENIVICILFAAINTWILGMFGRCVWSVFVNRSYQSFLIQSFHILMLLLTVLCLAGEGCFVFGEGMESSYVVNFLNAKENRLMQEKDIQSLEELVRRSEKQNELGIMLENGSLKVETVTYGFDEKESLLAKTVDMTPFCERPFISELGMKMYFQYELTETPLQGKVWYPKEIKEAPVLFIVHGNSDYTIPSYLGYEYLGEYLASYGYVVVSVNENAMNDLSDENDGRAVLLLENVKQILKYNEEKETPLYQKIDPERIALMGHSRGGECVAEAYLFNGYTHYPEDGNHKFDYGFQIKSLIAVAPTVDLYCPAERTVCLENVNYLLVHGMNDQDVRSMMGRKQYENIRFTDKNHSYMKTALTIAGANHGQFNTQWGRYDYPKPFAFGLNVKPLMAEEEQRNILKIFTKIFLDVTIKQDEYFKDIFVNCDMYNDVLPNTIYEQTIMTSDFSIISDFEEDTCLSTATEKDGTIHVSGADLWCETTEINGNNQERENHRLEVSWKKESDVEITIAFPERKFKNNVISMDLATKDMEKRLDGEIIIEDADGKSAAVPISKIRIIYPSIPVQLTKLDVLSGHVEYKGQFQTLSIPASYFKKENETIDLNRIVSIKIKPVTQEDGTLFVDNIGILEKKE